MESNYKNYSVSDSSKRIDDILNAPYLNYEEVDEIPKREDLTFTNGYYINMTGALFVDIRESSELTDEHKRPKLAKLYRSFISETVAVLNSNIFCKEINIEGDSVAGFFSCNAIEKIETMITTAAEINTLIKMLNFKFKSHDITEISVGIGITFGRSLMIKAGYYGSKINEIVWMGDVVNRASKLCNEAGKNSNDSILIDADVYNNISSYYKEWFSIRLLDPSSYEGDIYLIEMQEWVDQNC
ncbi:adenylate/guanylate cyclase domain-containing protein [Salibacterium salarium]|uniref:Adenylate/guanylate cyclase domain-containing protein n=1 Tax=Salibacterium salarium TaxID=284579 RepID=A0A3R9P8I1_9BACI|nr:adenylate/guanylate cyclase domain-containing protein [Salibacterium salarium]RSL32672.1 adenylate/guanylate cyclase domain-containing protein [Salibacterium salarium]